MVTFDTFNNQNDSFSDFVFFIDNKLFTHRTGANKALWFCNFHSQQYLQVIGANKVL